MKYLLARKITASRENFEKICQIIIPWRFFLQGHMEELHNFYGHMEELHNLEVFILCSLLPVSCL